MKEKKAYFIEHLAVLQSGRRVYSIFTVPSSGQGGSKQQRNSSLLGQVATPCVPVPRVTAVKRFWRGDENRNKQIWEPMFISLSD